ncbi:MULTISPECIES: ABC transporter permease [Bacillus]|uniref:ABC transporter permease n=1 Tax=Bacillus cereus TaxID=1396 RepID=A0A2A8JAQ4_BACCE|nr:MULTISPECIES: ABC transporter permease [Bacillus]MDH4421823.1 ABC transporter permease [Bacillus cereus]PER29928.1 ABC transporter permease [Bacillus cereus]PFA55645.1 ABC transporter permease [Bacillus sp. AFS015896]PGL84142.1 ABC transporter permease [Bacillus sp. AFS054943]PGU07726.1 ABC transporter permease [Bacillus cereus]
MSYSYGENCKSYKKKYHDCQKSSKCYDKYDGYYEKCDKKHEENPWVHVKVDCCDDKGEKLVRASAFRAIKTGSQNVPADTFVKVLFQNEQFDLANEYNPATSIFIPKTRGVYSVIGTIAFIPNNINVNYRARVEIRVNGNPAIAIDNDFFGPINFANVVAVSSIIQLNAGDLVEIFAQSSAAGVISNVENSTHFEAARFPSPKA